MLAEEASDFSIGSGSLQASIERQTPRQGRRRPGHDARPLALINEHLENTAVITPPLRVAIRKAATLLTPLSWAARAASKPTFEKLKRRCRVPTPQWNPRLWPVERGRGAEAEPIPGNRRL